MDTKQKAEAYDKLLIKAKQIYNKENDVLIIHTIEDLFPELVESGDEKVRKHLISLVKNWDKDGIASKYTSDPNDIKQILTWLEKQGKPIDEEKVLIGARKDVALSIMNFLDKNTLGMCLSNMECEDLEDAVVNSDWSKIYDYMKKKLEKQNEQKPYGQRKECSDCQFNYAGKCKGSCQMKRNEQKPTNKVEPKFKVGDFIVNDYCMGKVVELTNDAYLLDTEQGIPFSCEHNVHLWTIEDAKPGDVLINWNNTVFIFKAIEDETVKFHIAYNEKWDTIKTPSTKLSHMGLPEPQFEFHPATKEQCDLLFQKMKEAGYEWDAENLQLTKIFYVKELSDGINIDKQKTAEWSEEDERIYQSIIDDTVQENQLDSKQIDWLKSIKSRVQPKQEWSEEDKVRIEQICDDLECGLENFRSRKNVKGLHFEEIIKSNIDWLKSLKDRYIWKPSKEQMDALNNARWNAPFSIEILDSLYNDLEKLKE